MRKSQTFIGSYVKTNKHIKEEECLDKIYDEVINYFSKYKKEIVDKW